MADDFMRLSEELLPLVPGNLAEEVVGESDYAGEVGGRDDRRRIDRFAVFPAEVLGGYRVRVQKGDESFFEHAVEYVWIGGEFEDFFRRPAEVVETFRERPGGYAPKFLSGARADLGYYGGKEIPSYFVGEFSGSGYDALGLADFEPFLENFFAFFRYQNDNGVEKIPFSKAILVHKGQS